MFNVKSIFYEKLNQIQSRVPVRIGTINRKYNFNNFLNKASNIHSSKVSKNVLQSKDQLSLNKSANYYKYIDNVVNIAAKDYGIDPSLIKAIIKVESNFDQNIVSSKGAQGLMQLLPETSNALGVNNPFNIKENIYGGVRYFKDQLKSFNGDIALSLAAYNAGPNNVLKYGGIPPFSETQNYVKAVNKYYEIYKSEDK